MKNFPAALLLAAVQLVTALSVTQAADEKAAETAIKPAEVTLGRPVDFERDIYPILDANCIACHQASCNSVVPLIEKLKW